MPRKTYIVTMLASATRDFRIRANSLEEAKQTAWERSVRSFPAVKSWNMQFEGDDSDHIYTVTDTDGNVVLASDEESEE